MVKSRVLVKRVQSHVYLSHFGLFFLLILFIVRGGIFELLHTADFERVLLFCRLGNIVVASSKTGEPITADDMVCKQLENTLLRWRLQSNLFFYLDPYWRAKYRILSYCSLIYRYNNTNILNVIFMLLHLHVSPLMRFIWLNGACLGDKMVQGCREHSCVWHYSATEHQLSNSKTANIINYFLFMHYQKWLCNMNWSMLHIPNILPLSIRHAALVVTAILRRSCFSTYLPGGFSSHLALALEYSLCFLFRV